jgi:hypothetical protein
MKNIVLALLLLVAGISGVGLYRGWFSVNQQKIEQDEGDVKTEMHDLGEKAREKASAPKSLTP